MQHFTPGLTVFCFNSIVDIIIDRIETAMIPNYGESNQYHHLMVCYLSFPQKSVAALRAKLAVF